MAVVTQLRRHLGAIERTYSQKPDRPKVGKQKGASTISLAFQSETSKASGVRAEVNKSDLAGMLDDTEN